MPKLRDLRLAGLHHEFDVADDEWQMRSSRPERVRRTLAGRSKATDSSAPNPTHHHPSPTSQARNGALTVPDLSCHAKTRLQQRGITIDQVVTVMDLGREQRSFGATRFFLDRKARTRMAVEMPHALRSLPSLDILVVMGDDGRLITAAHRTRRTRNH